MIPLRIRLSGFLSYRAEQTLDFEGTTVWMLAGPNGSGKSSVFDALTYALFGQHRSGAADAAELINKQCDGLSVEFEFAVGPERYLIRRTLKRATRGRSSTQQILRQEGPGGSWTPISETNKKRGFDDWVSENIGLRFDTFTSSVLLLQGQAERLLSRTPAERFQILADVVDLERYQRLHARVDDERRRLRAEVEVLSHQLDGLPPVADEELAAVTSACDAAAGERNRLTTALADLQTAAIAAHRWADLQRRLAELRQRRLNAERLVADADAIERAARRLADLQAAIPLVERALTERGGVDTARRAIDSLVAVESEARKNSESAVGQLETARARLSKLTEKLRADETEQARLANERLELAPAVARFDSLAGQQNELRRLQDQLDAVPADLGQSIAQLTGTIQELELLERAAPALTRILTDRERWREREQAKRDMLSRLQAVAARGAEFNELLARLQVEINEKARELSRAQDAVASARTLHSQAAERLDAIRRMTDEPSCSLCGQPLTAAHREQETQRRTAECAAAEQACRSAEGTHETVRLAHVALSQKVADTTRNRDAERESYRALQQRQLQCETDLDRLRRSLDDAYLEVPESLRGRIAPGKPEDWAATAYPTEADLATLRQRIIELPTARQRLQAVLSQQRAADEWRSGIESLRRAIASVATESPDAIAAIRQKLARCEAEMSALGARITAGHTEVSNAERETERAGREADAARNRHAEIAGTLQTERATLGLREAALAGAVAALPEVWRSAVEQAGLADLDSWKRERMDLQASGAAERLSELAVARAEIAALAGDETRLTGEIDSVPSEARRELAEVDAGTRTAQADLDRIDTQLRERNEELFRLRERQTRRLALTERRSLVRADHERHERLAELLGRNRLQMDLVRRAERHIVELANAALDRLSGGSLHLRRRPSEDDRDVALDLECVNRAAGESAIAVPFLSGSQRFRVAVSLALGIGRFASGQHRPIESVIIDEGFGSLDRNGRQVMIQELQNLRGVLKRILLVSHQEEFADAFDDGYRFELVDGATQVTRYSRGYGGATG